MHDHFSYLLVVIVLVVPSFLLISCGGDHRYDLEMKVDNVLVVPETSEYWGYVLFYGTVQNISTSNDAPTSPELNIDVYSIIVYLNILSSANSILNGSSAWINTAGADLGGGQQSTFDVIVTFYEDIPDTFDYEYWATFWTRDWQSSNYGGEGYYDWDEHTTSTKKEHYP